VEVHSYALISFAMTTTARTEYMVRKGGVELTRKVEQKRNEKERNTLAANGIISGVTEGAEFKLR